MSKVYRCDLCFTNFVSKSQYNGHVECCKFFFRTRTDEGNKTPAGTDPIPNNRMLYEGLKNCMLRLKTLEEIQAENIELKKIIQRERRKIDIIDYLKMRYPIVAMDFSSMVGGPLKDIQQKHLEAVFHGTIIDGVVSLVSEFIDNYKDSCFPICIFSHKRKTLFVYDRLEWVEYTEEARDEFIGNWFELLANRFFGTYRRWEQKRLEFMVETEEMKQQKMALMKKVLANYISDDFKLKKFKSFLVNKLQQDVKNFVEYEFV